MLLRKISIIINSNKILYLEYISYENKNPFKNLSIVSTGYDKLICIIGNAHTIEYIFKYDISIMLTYIIIKTITVPLFAMVTPLLKINL